VTEEAGIVTAQVLTVIVDVAGRATVTIGATTEADARRPARGALLD
jgi:hypothetical protein